MSKQAAVQTPTDDIDVAFDMDPRPRGARLLARRVRWKLMQYLPKQTLTCGTVHGCLTFSSRDSGIGKYLYLQGAFDEKEMCRAWKILRILGQANRQSIFVDVGANIGTTCLYMMRSKYFCRALAIEPEPKSYGLLRQNIAQNALLHQVTAVPVALSDRPGSASLMLSAHNHGDSRLRRSAPPADEGERHRVDVPVDRLDDVLRAHGLAVPSLGMVWMDTQGHEFFVLKGAKEVRQAGVPLVCEFWPEGMRRCGSTVTDLMELLAQNYGQFYDLRATDLVPRPISELLSLGRLLLGPEDYTDVLFVAP